MSDLDPAQHDPDRPDQPDGLDRPPAPPTGSAHDPAGKSVAGAGAPAGKPPLYQRPWVIAIGALVLFVLIFGGGDDDTPDAEEQVNDAATEQSEPAPQPKPEADPEPEAEPEPEPEPEPVTTFDAVVIEGSGDDIIDVPVVAGAPIVATFTHTGSSNFAVISFDENGGRLDLLVNDIGRYGGTVPFNFSVPPAELEITADGPWTVTLSDLRDQPVYDSSATGSGGQVLLVTADAGRLAATHDGSSNFVIRAWGDRRSLMVNEIGVYSGTVRLPDAVALEIKADGN